MFCNICSVCLDFIENNNEKSMNNKSKSSINNISTYLENNYNINNILCSNSNGNSNQEICG